MVKMLCLEMLIRQASNTETPPLAEISDFMASFFVVRDAGRKKITELQRKMKVGPFFGCATKALLSTGRVLLKQKYAQNLFASRTYTRLFLLEKFHDLNLAFRRSQKRGPKMQKKTTRASGWKLVSS